MDVWRRSHVFVEKYVKPPYFLIASSVCTSLLPEVACEWQSPPVTCSVTQETTALYCQPTPGPSLITCNTILDLIKLSSFLLLGLNFVIHNCWQNRIFQFFSSFTISGETFGKQWICLQVLCIISPPKSFFKCHLQSFWYMRTFSFDMAFLQCLLHIKELKQTLAREVDKHRDLCGEGLNVFFPTRCSPFHNTIVIYGRLHSCLITFKPLITSRSRR